MSVCVKCLFKHRDNLTCILLLFWFLKIIYIYLLVLLFLISVCCYQLTVYCYIYSMVTLSFNFFTHLSDFLFASFRTAIRHIRARAFIVLRSYSSRLGRDADHLPHLVPRSRMSRSYTFSLPPNTSMACSGTALHYVTSYISSYFHL
jgi:hypothetical protein